MIRTLTLKKVLIVIAIFICFTITVWGTLIIANSSHYTRNIYYLAVVSIILSLLLLITTLYLSDKLITIYRAEYDGFCMELVDIEDDRNRLICVNDNDFEIGDYVSEKDIVITRDSTIIEGLECLSVRKKANVIRIS